MNFVSRVSDTNLFLDSDDMSFNISSEEIEDLAFGLLSSLNSINQ